jgi:hypothetical protein
MKYQVGAAQEQYVCQLVQMPTTPDGGQVYTSGRSHQYNTGSHHYGLYRTTLDKLPAGAALNQPEDCWGPHDYMQYATDFVILEQKSTADVEFPKGVSLPFKSGELMVMELHSINTSQTPADVWVNATLKTEPKSEVQQEMALLQFYDPFIIVPPLSHAAAALRCAVPNDVTMIEANPHFHLRGVDHKSYIDLPNQPPSTTPFMESTSWSDPPQWRGSMNIPGGSHVRFHCDYQNNDNFTYLQGPSKQTNEMCSFWAYVYPAPADRNIIDCTGANDDQFGVGDQTCTQTLDCINACPPGEAPDLSIPGKFTVGPCYTQCIVNSCPSAGTLVSAVGACVTKNCGSACPGDSCASCIQTNCAAEMSSCQSATCN